MAETEVLICRRGSLSPRSLRDLRHAGVVVVEADEPEQCRLVRSGQEVSGSDMLWAAMAALQAGGDWSGAKEQRIEFTKLIFELLNAGRKERAAKPDTGARDE